MLNKVDFKKLIFVVGTLFVLFCPALSYAYGDDHGRDFDRHDHYYRYHDHPRYGLRIDVVSREYMPVAVGGAEYYYYDGLYYAPEGRHGYVLIQPPVGAIVPAIPEEYRPVMIGGVTYYTDDGIYYVFTRHGYRVVEPPMVRVVPQTVIVEQPAPVVVQQAPMVVEQPAPETPNKTKVVEGATIGGVLGALTGGIIGHQMKGHNEARGALLGGVAGAVVGGVAGAQMPNKEASTPATAAPAVSPASPDQGSGDSVTVNVPNKNGGYTPVVLKKSGSGYVGPQGEYYSEFPKVSQLQAMYSK